MNDLASASQDDAPSHLARLRGGFRAVLRQALDAALPPLCPSCREPLGDGVGLCAACWSKLSFIEPPYCARLGIPFTYDPGPGLLSMEAIAAPPAYDRARAAVRYDDTARALVLSFKYGDRLDLAPMMGRWMARAGRELLGGRRRAAAGAAALAQAVVAPLQPVGGARRQRSRRLTGVPVLHDTLKRVRATPQQVGLSKTERADNVQGAFKVPPGQKAEVAGRRLVLIDDVLTSGATVDTCARALLRAGAAHVDVLVFARVVAPVRSPI